MKDYFPGRPKILFVCLMKSTHTHSWLSLLKDMNINVRAFAVDGVIPNYFNLSPHLLTDNYLYRFSGKDFYWNKLGIIMRGSAILFGKDILSLDNLFLARAVRAWKPDIVHTLGLEPASYVFLKAREILGSKQKAKWIVTARGGPELTIKSNIPEVAENLANVFRACDQFIADNQHNYDLAMNLGLEKHKMCSLGVVPGTGGIDIDSIISKGDILPSKKKRIILWPKAYECPASKALPVFEALTLCWDRISPCEVYMTAMTQETMMWFMNLPEHIRKSCHISERIPRSDLLDIMLRSRVLLTPSLTDGIPNVLYEAMASCVFPIVSPIDTLQNIVSEEDNVLFARNLYPNEISNALIRAMNDDELVDSAAKRNVELVKSIANKNIIANNVYKNYINLIK